MCKIVNYLNNRLAMLLEKKDSYNDKLNKINLEKEEIQKKIEELKGNIDEAYDIFSPRKKKNDFVKEEIEELEAEADICNEKIKDYKEKIRIIEEDAECIKDALEEKNTAESIEDDNNGINETNDTKNEIKQENKFSIVNGFEIIKREEAEKKCIAANIQSGVVEVIKNLVHKCEVCQKVVEVDTGRTKLELGAMKDILEKAETDIKQLVYEIYPVDYAEYTDIRQSLEELIEKQQPECGIKYIMDIKQNVNDIGEIDKINLTRILRAVTGYANEYIRKNSEKNKSQAKNKVNVLIEHKDKNIYLSIKSSDLYIEDIREGCELESVKQRVGLCCGSIDIYTEEGMGTDIEILMPVEK